MYSVTVYLRNLDKFLMEYTFLKVIVVHIIVNISLSRVLGSVGVYI